MKIYANLIDNEKNLVMYKIKYSASTLKNQKVDSYKYYIGYEEDINDNLQIVGEFYKYIDRTHNNKVVFDKHLDIQINSIKFIKNLNVYEDENGKFIAAHKVKNMSEIIFSDSFFFVKNVMKVG